jgi:hypothetical protein
MVHGSRVYVGGNFRQIDEKTQSYLASLSGTHYFNRELVDPKLGSSGPSPTTALQLGVPSPIGAEGVIHFVLPSAGTVQLAVFDTTGRRVVNLIDGRQMAAGRHETILTTKSMAVGVYFAHLSFGSERASRKIVVIH